MFTRVNQHSLSLSLNPRVVWISGFFVDHWENMAEDIKESVPHEQCASGSSASGVRDDQKSLNGMSQPRRKLKDLLLSAASNSDTGFGLSDLSDRTKNTVLQSSLRTLPSDDYYSGPRDSDEKAILDYQPPEDSYGGFDRFGFASSSSSSLWCGYSNCSRRNECAKQSLISRIFTGEDRPIYNDLRECGREGCIFDESSLDPLGSKFESDEEWEMGSSALDNTSPLKGDALEKRGELHHLDEPAMVACQKPLFSTVPSLLIRQQNSGASSWTQDISQMIGVSQLVECGLDEAMSKIEERKFALIWLKLSVPISQDSLDILQHVRTASKKNKDSHLVVVVNKQPNVDLRAKEADDVLVEPVSKETIRNLYSKLDAASQCGPDSARTSSTSLVDRAGTPESSISTSSKRTDLDLESTSSPSKGLAVSPPKWCRMEHATKEKQRRERIKDSCDQLRVLLPYVKGRKTDMASILEMTVDYLKIVSSALPEDFHSEIIEIMSTGSPPLEGNVAQNMGGMSMALAKKNAKKGTSAPVRSNLEPYTFCHTDVNMNKRMTTRALTRAAGGGLDSSFPNLEDHTSVQTSCGSLKLNKSLKKNSLVIPAKREYPENVNTSGNAAKRPHINLKTSQTETMSNSSGYFTSENSGMDPKRETFLDDIAPNTYHGLQYSQPMLGGDVGNKRNFPSSQMPMNSSFPYGSQSQVDPPTLRMANVDRADGPYGSLYFDSAYYHYPYSSLQDSNNGNYFLPSGTNEYVNPNAVLPVTSHAPRVSASSRKLDRMSTTPLSRLAIDNSDSFNNNTNSNMNSNNSFLNSPPL